MAKIYVCDICGNKMSKFKIEQARIDIFSKVGAPGNKSYEIAIECCENCAQEIHDAIIHYKDTLKAHPELRSSMIERNDDGSDATNTEE